MARNFARIKTSIWDDPDWRATSRGAKYLYTLMSSQPDLSMCGVLVYRPKLWASFCPDDTVEVIDELLRECEAAEMVAVDREADEVWLRAFIADNEVLRSGQNARSCARAYQAVRSQKLRRRILGVLPDGLVERFPEGFVRGSIKDLQTLLEDPFSEPMQLGLSLPDAPSDGASETPSDGAPDGCGVPDPGVLSPESGVLIPDNPPASDVDDTGPDLTVVGEDPMITKAMEHLAQQDLEMAVLRAANGQGEPIQSPARFKRYRVGENRKLYVAEAKRVIDTYEIDAHTTLAEVLIGSRKRNYLVRRHA